MEGSTNGGVSSLETKAPSSSMVADASEQRENHRLDHGVGAFKTTGVAPLFKIMRGRHRP